MQILRKEPDALERLLSMDTEEAIAVVRQLFNPMKGTHVGYTGTKNRRSSCNLAEKEQNKMEDKIPW